MPDKPIADKCPNCQTVVECDTHLGAADRTPGPGDLSICLYCNAISVFNDLLFLRLPTQEEVNAWQKDQQLWAKLTKYKLVIGAFVKAHSN